MRAFSVIILLALLVFPTAVSAEVQTFTATHTYVLGDRDSKEEARAICYMNAKRKVLDKAGVLIESSSEIKNLQLTKDQVNSYSAAIVSVEIVKEEFAFNNGTTSLTLTVKANLDMAEIRERLAEIVAGKGLERSPQKSKAKGNFAVADDETFQKLYKAKSLKCTFEAYSIADWKGGEMKVANGREKLSFIFDSINHKEGTARGMSNLQAVDERVIPTALGFTFIEQTAIGNITITTVFGSYRKETEEFSAVHSRHMDMPGGPLPSQYYGTCEIYGH